MCQMFSLSPTDLQYKWEALSFSNTRSISIFTMDSCAALKAKCQRDKVAEQAKSNKLSGRAPMPGNMDITKGRIGPAKFGAPKLDGPLSVGLPPVKSFAGTPGLGDEKIAGPSKVTFKGPDNNEMSRKKRACELQFTQDLLLCSFRRQIHVREGIGEKRRYACELVALVMSSIVTPKSSSR